MSDRDLLYPLDGLFVGLLDPEEVAALDRLCAAGEASRVYEGVAGGLGLAKFRLKEQISDE